MKISTIELKKITAAKGKILTNGEIYGKEIFLGVNDTTENWYEITEEEYSAVCEKTAEIQEV